jgi:hypothetical protein
MVIVDIPQQQRFSWHFSIHKWSDLNLKAIVHTPFFKGSMQHKIQVPPCNYNVHNSVTMKFTMKNILLMVVV